MQILDDIAAMRAFRAKHNGQKLVFVPTMGSLHEGHMALMRKAHSLGDVVIASIFVNRLQFGPNEDFERYPRSFADDCAKLTDAGVDAVFAPSEASLYPEAQTYLVDPPDIQRQLEGEFRPGHFRGVATIVLKLFNIVQPQVALFGKKDYQQLMVLSNMTRQLALPIEIVGDETVRASDGLALSSRNAYLTDEQRAEAPMLYRCLINLCNAIKEGAQDFNALENTAKAHLDARGWQTDYIAILQRADLQKAVASSNAALVIVAAARLGSTRLIDNIEV